MLGIDEQLAAAWSAIIEPGDRRAGALLRVLGAEEALAWMRRPHATAVPGVAQSARLHSRLHPRAVTCEPEKELERAARLGSFLIWRGHKLWPERLSVLEDGEPVAFWVKGDAELLSAVQVSIVGARASTAYGNRVATDLGAELASRQVTVTSGGAYGIDAAAHLGALHRGTTVAVLCGGLGNLYPKGNEELLRRIGDQGLLVTEVPPGFRPARWRFIERNRVIAALAQVVVVVEAGVRSGAMATANRAAELGIDVAAVPGPVTSAASCGTHELIREGATLVTSCSDVLEMLRWKTGESAGAGPAASGANWEDGAKCREGATCTEGANYADPLEQRVWEAFPFSGRAAQSRLVLESGLSTAEVDVALIGLRLRGVVVLEEGEWRRL